MKVIAVGDPHFQTENVVEVNMFVERLEKLAIEQKPDIIVILGDVLHTHERLHSTPLNIAVDFIERMSKITETYVLVGNHDYVNNQQFLTTNHWMNCLKTMPNVFVADKVLYKIKDNIKLAFCPYVPPGRFQEALDTSAEIIDWKEMNCIFAHQEFYGCKMGAILSVEGDKWSEEYPQVVSGHIHSKQTIQKNIYYCGSAMQHAFGETEDNIIPIFEWKDPTKPYTLLEIDLELPRRRTIYEDVSNAENIEIPITEDKIKISFNGTYDEFKAHKKTKKYREFLKAGIKVVFKAKKVRKGEEEKEGMTNESRDLKETVSETDFNMILSTLVNNERNPHLCEIYELILNSKEVSADDIVFLQN